MSGSGGRRSFPYWSQVQSFDIQGGPLPRGARPGHEDQQPRTFQEGSGFEPEPSGQTQGVTDFSSWTEAQIKEFLEQRGEDYDDCTTFAKLVVRAQECEVSTGPAPDPKQEGGGGAGAPEEEDEEEDDPLDAFMAGIETEVKAAKAKPAAPRAHRPELDEEEDNVADFLEARKAAGVGASALASAYHGTGYNSDEEVYATATAMTRGDDVEYDENDNPIVKGDRRTIEPMAALEHSNVEYDDFCKDFYTPTKEVADMPEHEVNALRRQLDVRIGGFDCPRPVKTFRQCGFDVTLMAVINKMGYTAPTAIQAQAIPAALSGRDVLGIAKTGSGKTAAFTLPMVVHIMDQPELAKGEGPIGLIVAPTRELSEQIHKEVRKFSKPYGLTCVAAFGGISKHEQFKHLKSGSEVAICTPGRMIDLLKMKACTCLRTTYLVFDEADRMFDMGFEPQVRSIIGQIRPDRQTMLFSATMPRRVEDLARDALVDPIRVTVGRVGAANEDINQVVQVLPDNVAKFGWLFGRIQEFIDQGDVMVFVNQRANVDEVVEKLKAQGCKADGVHGDHDQHTRMGVLKRFRDGEIHVMVATDVAARGLDIKSIKTVINVDFPRDMDTYVHRIGRTGRAGDKDGVAYTLITQAQTHQAGDLVNALVASNKQVPRELHDLAVKSPRFRQGGRGGGGGGGKRGNKQGGGDKRRRQVGGSGIGFGPTLDPLEAAGVRPPPPPAAALPPPPPLPAADAAAAPHAPPAAAAAAAPRFAPAARPMMSGFVSASSSAPQQQQQQQPRQQAPPQMSGMRAAMSSRFKTSFVSSSTSTLQPDAPVATVYAPKRAPTQPVAPPPLPAALAAAPAIAAQQLAHGLSGSGPAPQQGSASFSSAVAAAQAVAARLSSFGGGGGTAAAPEEAASAAAAAAAHPEPAAQEERRKRRKWDT